MPIFFLHFANMWNGDKLKPWRVRLDQWKMGNKKEPCLNEFQLILCINIHGLYMYIYLCIYKYTWIIQSMEFPRQEYGSGQPFPSPRDLPTPGIESGLQHRRWILHQLSHREAPMCKRTAEKSIVQGALFKALRWPEWQGSPKGLHRVGLFGVQ